MMAFFFFNKKKKKNSSVVSFVIDFARMCVGNKHPRRNVVTLYDSFPPFFFLLTSDKCERIPQLAVWNLYYRKLRWLEFVPRHNLHVLPKIDMAEFGSVL